MSEPRSITVLESITVDGDIYEIVLTLSRPKNMATDRDMGTIKGEVQRLLPGWIKSKIQAGDP